MLDRTVVEEFFDFKLKELEVEIPGDISKEALVEALCSKLRMIITSGLRTISSLSSSMASLIGSG